MQFFQLFLALLVPGLLGALVFSIAARFTTEITTPVALLLDLFTFTIMITGLYFFQGVKTVADLVTEFGCLSFTRKYILLSLLINVVLGVLLGLLRRLFFWIRRGNLFRSTPIA